MPSSHYAGPAGCFLRERICLIVGNVLCNFLYSSNYYTIFLKTRKYGFDIFIISFSCLNLNFFLPCSFSQHLIKINVLCKRGRQQFYIFFCMHCLSLFIPVYPPLATGLIIPHQNLALNQQLMNMMNSRAS
jgi:hypothetical protein